MFIPNMRLKYTKIHKNTQKYTKIHKNKLISSTIDIFPYRTEMSHYHIDGNAKGIIKAERVKENLDGIKDSDKIPMQFGEISNIRFDDPNFKIKIETTTIMIEQQNSSKTPTSNSNLQFKNLRSKDLQEITKKHPFLSNQIPISRLIQRFKEEDWIDVDGNINGSYSQRIIDFLCLFIADETKAAYGYEYKPKGTKIQNLSLLQEWLDIEKRSQLTKNHVFTFQIANSTDFSIYSCQLLAKRNCKAENETKWQAQYMAYICMILEMVTNKAPYLHADRDRLMKLYADCLYYLQKRIQMSISRNQINTTKIAMCISYQDFDAKILYNVLYHMSKDIMKFYGGFTKDAKKIREKLFLIKHLFEKRIGITRDIWQHNLHIMDAINDGSIYSRRANNLFDYYFDIDLCIHTCRYCTDYVYDHACVYDQRMSILEGVPLSDVITKEYFDERVYRPM